MATSVHLLFNGSGVSVVYDSDGHALDAGDRIEGNPNGRILSRLIASGQLTDLGPVAKDTQPPAEDDVEPDSADAATDETN